MLLFPWIGQVLGSQSTQLANWKEDIERRLWRQKSFKAQGSNNSFRFSFMEPRHLAEFCPAEDNNSLCLIEIFITLGRVHEATYGKQVSETNICNSIGYWLSPLTEKTQSKLIHAMTTLPN
jgi:hypothetical protein